MVGVQSRYSLCFFSQSSKPNELIFLFNTMLYDSVESTGIVDPGPILNANTFNIVTSRV